MILPSLSPAVACSHDTLYFSTNTAQQARRDCNGGRSHDGSRANNNGNNNNNKGKRKLKTWLLTTPPTNALIHAREAHRQPTTKTGSVADVPSTPKKYPTMTRSLSAEEMKSRG
ncbi:unnamed protein product [Penicillium camemberti]|uniref:Str. FM013 n=1 Tax=Penicillium camemberti (strain FM 013) TaxID=1429867 RepID=A0A0G4PN39_PENC3|nr:unnamed protein product [Penicillium camemberti]